MIAASSVLKRQGCRLIGLRRLQVSALAFKAQVLGMPAMSPTMEKGGIVEWKFKVGDTFSAGEVLLEVETDKAQIDVEAQDDGKIASIVKENGSKDVKVGEPIAYLAEIDDDLSTLEIPKGKLEEKPQAKKESAPKPAQENSTSRKIASPSSSSKAYSGILAAANSSQTLLPSVQMLLHENNISFEDAINKIPASGPNGRILKGDVLSYLGKISQDSVVKVTKYIKKGQVLDLSNIELKKPETATQAEKSKISKPQPVVFNEQLHFKVPPNVSIDRLSASLKSYINEAKWLSHEQHVANTQSQLYDPVFEDLITPEPKQPRFTATYELLPVSGQHLTPAQQDDIFDLLSGTGSSSPAKLEESQPNEFMVNLNVEVNSKFDDSIIKAERFVNYVKDLEIFAEN